MSSPLQHAELVLEADVDQDGQQETGRFVMVGNLSVTPGLRTGFIVGGRGSTANSVFSSLVEQYGTGNTSAFQNPSKREGVHLDLGGGEHSVDVEFRGWEGATLSDGTPVQWGNDPNPGRTQASATGQDPITQIDVLLRYLTVGEYDSRAPATLEYGEYSTDGLFEPIDVAIEGPQAKRSSDDTATYSGTMTLIATTDIDNYRSALVRDGT